MSRSFDALEKLAQEDPAKAVSLAETLVCEVAEDQIVKVLAIVGSAYRRLEQHDDALHVLFEAERLASDVSTRADVAQRLAYVIAARGDFEAAIRKLLEAQNLYLLVGDGSAMGRTLVDQGMFRYHQGDLSSAALCLERALDWLGAHEVRNRFSALVGIALCVAQQEPTRADLLLDQAALEAEKVGRPLQWKWSWTKARLLEDRGEIRAARQILEVLAEDYLSRGHYLDASLAAVDLVRLSQILREEPVAFADLVRRIAFSLPEEGIAAAAVTHLWASCVRGSVRETVMSSVRDAVGRERRQATRAR